MALNHKPFKTFKTRSRVRRVKVWTFPALFHLQVQFNVVKRGEKPVLFFLIHDGIYTHLKHQVVRLMNPGISTSCQRQDALLLEPDYQSNNPNYQCHSSEERL